MLKPGYSYIPIVLLWTACFRPDLSAQSIEKNDYVNYEVIVENGRYEISYRFKDPFNNFQTYNLSLPQIETDLMAGKFGIPRWLFDPYVDNEINHRIRAKEINRGFFLLNDNVIEVDKSGVIAYYGEMFARPIAEMIVSSLADYGSDTRRNRIEFAMRFVQDIPYGIPPYHDDERHFGGVHIPPQLLVKGYGDCDSKVLLFAGILSYLIHAEDIIFLNQRDHVLSAVQDEPEEGLTYVRYKGREFLIAEISGPGKRTLGQKGSYFTEEFKIEPLSIDPPDVIPAAEGLPVAFPPTRIHQVEENILVLTNTSPTALQFEISPDNRNWEVMALRGFATGRYIYNHRTHLFLRLRSNRNKMLTYQVGTGKIYTLYWNEQKKKWEITST